jgi:hypothetical protein
LDSSDRAKWMGFGKVLRARYKMSSSVEEPGLEKDLCKIPTVELLEVPKVVEGWSSIAQDSSLDKQRKDQVSLT